MLASGSDVLEDRAVGVGVFHGDEDALVHRSAPRPLRG